MEYESTLKDLSCLTHAYDNRWDDYYEYRIIGTIYVITEAKVKMKYWKINSNQFGQPVSASQITISEILNNVSPEIQKEIIFNIDLFKNHDSE